MNAQNKKMKFGFIPIEGPHHYAEALEEILLAEKLGFDSAFIQERHLVRDSFWASPLIAASAMLARTSRIKIGTGILISPFYHPVRLAEDIATLDITSGGRFIFGTAIGYKPDEFELYGIDPSNRGARFEESFTIIKQLWSEGKADFHGKFYTVKTGAFEPRPRTLPHPPLWIGGWKPLMLERAARYADAWLPGVSADVERLKECKQIFLSARKKAGLDEPKEWPLNREVIIAEKSEDAYALAAKYLFPFYRDTYVGSWQHQVVSKEMVSGIEKLSRGRFIIGNPDEVIEKIRYFQAEFGMTHLICRFFFGDIPHQEIKKEIELFASHVIPVFQTPDKNGTINGR